MWGLIEKINLYFYSNQRNFILSLSNNLICLLIDDDEDDQELFALTLEDLQAPIDLYTVTSCFDGLEQLQSYSIKPDYIFLDLNMPRMNGKECLRLLKENVELQHIPVIIFSTSSELNDIHDTKQLGALDFITKPALTSELSHLLRNFFNRHQPYLLNQNTNEK